MQLPPKGGKGLTITKKGWKYMRWFFRRKQPVGLLRGNFFIGRESWKEKENIHLLTK